MYTYAFIFVFRAPLLRNRVVYAFLFFFCFVCYCYFVFVSFFIFCFFVSFDRKAEVVGGIEAGSKDEGVL